MSSVSGSGERAPVSPVRNFGVPVMTAEGVPVYEGPGVAASRAMPLPDFSKWTKSRQKRFVFLRAYKSVSKLDCIGIRCFCL